MPASSCQIFALVLLLSTYHLSGHLTFQKKIPNGNKIPHPCKPNTIWQGVGHLNPAGGGKLNPFGRAFANAGFTWTNELCKEDSDQDGKTNGEELGDPGCIWSEGKRPTRTTDLTHPGICEPVDSQKCSSQQWISCLGSKPKCSAKHDPNVLSTIVRMPRRKVPAQVTTLHCKTFLLPHDQDYHIVASDPVLDNPRVVHHMLLYGCNTDMVIEKEPFDCPRGNVNCVYMIAGWTVGRDGDCWPVAAGFRFGKSIYRYVLLQVHLTNAAKETGMYDSSGFKLYYTSKLRPYDLGDLVIGQVHLELPPHQATVTAMGTCDPKCTSFMLQGNGQVNVIGATLHAHALGKTLKISQYRNGIFLRYLAKNNAYDYNHPKRTIFDPPVSLLPGDELRTTCIYDTTQRKYTTYFGDGTYDEMCFAFIQYYPKVPSNRQQLCKSYERYTFCDIEVFHTAKYHEHNFGTCNFTEFEQHDYPAGIIRVCGSDPKECTKVCKYHVERMNSHRCMKGREKLFVHRLMKSKDKKMAADVWKALAVCAEEKCVGSAAKFIHHT